MRANLFFCMISVHVLFFIYYMTSFHILVYYSLGNMGYPRSHIPSYLSLVRCFKTCFVRVDWDSGLNELGHVRLGRFISHHSCFLLSLLEIPYSDYLLLFKIKNLFQLSRKIQGEDLFFPLSNPSFLTAFFIVFSSFSLKAL